MTFSKNYHPDPRFSRLGNSFADPVEAAVFPQTLLRYRNQRAASQIGLEHLSESQWISHFGRFTPLPDNQPQPLALRYHGHQFRQYNSDLGDGRGFLFAQLRDDKDRLLDLGTKGSGQTPWSRGADGRLTLKGAVREVLASSLLEARGVPTSRTLSVIETGESLMRGDEPSPTRSAVLVRLSHAHIRFGSFQRLAALSQPENLKTLLNHCLTQYMPDLLEREDDQRPAAFLTRIARLSAQLTARWIAAGFVHGVLNTDNMNINGESFDYGPWRFLPTYQPDFTAAYFDHQSLYAFGRQGEAVSWNLARLGEALASIAPIEGLQEAHKAFAQTYVQALPEAFLERLGLKPKSAQSNQAFLRTMLGALQDSQVSYEGFFFDWFCGCRDRAMTRPRLGLYQSPAFAAFEKEVETFETIRPERLDHAYFARENPVDLLVEDVEHMWDAIAGKDDWSLFNQMLSDIDAAGTAYAYPPFLTHSST